MISSAELGKMAGLLEGEAYFGRRAPYPKDLVIVISMTDRDVIGWVAGHWGVIPWLEPLRQERRRLYRATVCSRKAAQWMMTIFPLMGERRKAKIAALLAEWRKPNRPSPADINRVKTECPRGHPYDEANTYRMKEHGSRYCRACWKIQK